MSDDRPGSVTRTQVETFHDGSRRTQRDQVVTEEPMEIRLELAHETRPIAVTMRTPGNDFELAAGFLFAEGVISSHDDIDTIAYCLDRSVEPDQRFNIVTVKLASSEGVDLAPLERHFSMTSACGVCGKGSIDALSLRGFGRFDDHSTPDPEVLGSLPDKLLARQSLFEATGGIHAAGLFTADGGLVDVREDVGRHNALDKLFGRAVLDRKVPLAEHIVLVSGRISFEIVQKSLAAGVPVVAGVSAPTSLAVDVARTFNMALVGFLRGPNFTVYAGDLAPA
jgi:FdhD protein